MTKNAVIPFKKKCSVFTHRFWNMKELTNA